MCFGVKSTVLVSFTLLHPLDAFDGSPKKAISLVIKSFFSTDAHDLAKMIVTYLDHPQVSVIECYGHTLSVSHCAIFYSMSGSLVCWKTERAMHKKH